MKTINSNLTVMIYSFDSKSNISDGNLTTIRYQQSYFISRNAANSLKKLFTVSKLSNFVQTKKNRFH